MLAINSPLSTESVQRLARTRHGAPPGLDRRLRLWLIRHLGRPEADQIAAAVTD